MRINERSKMDIEVGAGDIIKVRDKGVDRWIYRLIIHGNEVGYNAIDIVDCDIVYRQDHETVDGMIKDMRGMWYEMVIIPKDNVELIIDNEQIED